MTTITPNDNISPSAPRPTDLPSPTLTSTPSVHSLGPADQTPPPPRRRVNTSSNPPSPKLGTKRKIPTWRSLGLSSLSDAKYQARNLFEPRKIHHLRAPLQMLLFFATGLGMSVGHCVFYPGLNGVIVGDAASQENKITVGTAFSFIAEIALTASVWISYTQWLWRTIRKTEGGLTVNCLNKGFSADTSPWALFDREMLGKFKVGSIMAFFAWCLIIPPFFTPATIFVVPSTDLTHIEQSVPILDINGGAESDVWKYAYSPPTRSGDTRSETLTRTLLGPRTIVSLLSTAAASAGRILELPAPSNRSSYSVDFYAPIVQCAAASTFVSLVIDELLAEKMAVPVGTAREEENAYFAFVPSIDGEGKVTPLWHPRYQTYSVVQATNELWMTFLRYVRDGDGNRVREKERVYQRCKLFNSSYHLDMSWDHGFQTVDGRYEVLNAVLFPSEELGEASDAMQHAYSAVFWALTNQVVGSMSWYVETEAEGNLQDNPDGEGVSKREQYGVIDTPIPRNSLLGSDDLDVYFDFDEFKKVYNEDVDPLKEPLSPQRLQDKNLARNETLGTLIEELSFNISVSLMRNELLTQNTTTIVQHWQDVNRYGYSRVGLFLPYAISNAIALVIVIMGMVSFIRDGVLPERKFQDIVAAAEDPEIISVVRENRTMTMEVVEGRVVLRAGKTESSLSGLGRGELVRGLSLRKGGGWRGNPFQRWRRRWGPRRTGENGPADVLPVQSVSTVD